MVAPSLCSPGVSITRPTLAKREDSTEERSDAEEPSGPSLPTPLLEPAKRDIQHRCVSTVYDRWAYVDCDKLPEPGATKHEEGMREDATSASGAKRGDTLPLSLSGFSVLAEDSRYFDSVRSSSLQ